MILIQIYLFIINAVAFVFMLVDKIKAQNNAWRIPERVLLGLCAAGGSLGGLLGMKLIRHKTRKPAFAFGIPAMLIVHIILCAVIGVF